MYFQFKLDKSGSLIAGDLYSRLDIHSPVAGFALKLSFLPLKNSCVAALGAPISLNGAVALRSPVIFSADPASVTSRTKYPASMITDVVLSMVVVLVSR